MSFREIREKFTKSMESPNSQNIIEEAEVIWSKYSNEFEATIKNYLAASTSENDIVGLEDGIKEDCKQLQIKPPFIEIMIKKAQEIYTAKFLDPNIR